MISRVDELLDEYTETKEFVEERKPYWLFLDGQDEMRWGLFNYFPAAHYKAAIDQALLDEAESELVPDGGRYTDTLYAWYDPDTQAFLYHTEANGEFADPFFDDEDDARNFLEQQAETNGKGGYENLSLQKLRAKKIGEAVEVLTDQSGIEDFIPDGGIPDTAYLWYDPATDTTIDGIFHDKEEAIRYIADYTPGYNLDHIEHFELYEAKLDKIGNARTFIK